MTRVFTKDCKAAKAARPQKVKKIKKSKTVVGAIYTGGIKSGVGAH